MIFFLSFVLLSDISIEKMPTLSSSDLKTSIRPYEKNGLYQSISVGPLVALGPISEIYGPHVYGTYSIGVRLESFGLGASSTLGALVNRFEEKRQDLYLTFGDLSFFFSYFKDLQRISVSVSPIFGLLVIQDPHNDMTVAGPSISLSGNIGFRISPTSMIGFIVRWTDLIGENERKKIEFWSPKTRTLYIVSPRELYGSILYFGVSLTWY